MFTRETYFGYFSTLLGELLNEMGDRLFRGDSFSTFFGQKLNEMGDLCISDFILIDWFRKVFLLLESIFFLIADLFSSIEPYSSTSSNL